MVNYLPNVLLLVLVGLSSCLNSPPPEVEQNDGFLYATCKVRPSKEMVIRGRRRVSGQVGFKQAYPEGQLEMAIDLKGFPSDSVQPRAVHIHQYGDIGRNCDSTGGHYNPHRINHPGHPGDFGNFVTRNGKVRAQMRVNATLFGRLSVLGRAVVVHDGKDDLGQGGNKASLLHGNAGERLACCLIGISTKENWEKVVSEVQRRN